ncbi:hypothetical protein ECANGB1_2609 [Enterospora canceri]|uniref:Secreted protein n=1 Tax=Enterospora canceri TaxID=1081671 RepID=A0A1Y1S9L7_9MICR|nr:hypothetical protein ECANGB1_2609 [Enterospora canceri]
MVVCLRAVWSMSSLGSVQSTASRTSCTQSASQSHPTASARSCCFETFSGDLLLNILPLYAPMGNF